MSFNSQKGVVTLAAILLGFGLAGLVTTGTSVYTHVKEKAELGEVVQMIRDNASNLKKGHGDDPQARAQAEAWESMADAIERNQDLTYDQKMIKEAVNLGTNLIPGSLPLKEGTKELIELGKDIYDLNNAINQSYGEEPKEPSEEMKNFLKAISKGKLDADALEMAMLYTKERAVFRKLEELEKDIEANEEWQKRQDEHLDDYQKKFIGKTLEQLEKTGKLSSFYKRLWGQRTLQAEISKYPQIAQALQEIEEQLEESAAEEEKEIMNQVVHEIISQDEELTELVAKSLIENKGDDERDINQIVKELVEIAVEDTSQEVEPEPEEEETLLNDIAKIWRGGTHNSFNFKSDGSRLKYEAVRYDGYSIGTGYISGVKQDNFISYNLSLWNQNNAVVVVYVTNNGKLNYAVIEPYAVCGVKGCHPKITYSGRLAEGIDSIDQNEIQISYKGKFGIHLRWAGSQGKTYEADINQWHGLLSKKKLSATNKNTGKGIATGRVLPCPDYATKGPCKSDLEYLERMKQHKYGETMTCIEVREDKNYLELNFSPEGGRVTGSFTWQFVTKLQTKGTDHIGLNDNHWEGTLTGSYSGGKKGSFSGDVKGSTTFIYSSSQKGGETSSGEPSKGSFEGTWTAKMKADGKIEGELHYTSIMPTGQRFEDYLNFRAD